MWLLYVIRSVIHLHFYVNLTFWEALVGGFFRLFWDASVSSHLSAGAPPGDSPHYIKL